jgi:hypothetical protein
VRWVCQALKNLQTSQTLLKVAGVAIGLAWVKAISQGEPVTSLTPLALIAAASGTFWLSSVLNSLEAKFTFQEYNHGKS